MGDVVSLDVKTTLDIPPEKVLRRAIETGMTEVVICGIAADGTEFFASSVANGADTHWHLQRAMHQLMKQADNVE